MHERIVSAFVALTWASIASATAPVLQPVDNWSLDYGETQCTAARSFGTPSDPVTLGIVPSLSGKSYRLLVSVPRKGPRFAEESRGTVDFGRGPISSGVLYYGGGGVRLSVYQFRVSAEDLGQARAAGTITLRPRSRAEFTFALSQMPTLLDWLPKCTSDLQRYWNSEGQGIAVPEAPVRDIRSLFTPADYPTQAFARHEQGAAQYQVLVDEKGRAAGCDLLVSSGAPALDSTGCELITERAKFKPARDSGGRPVRSVWTTPPVTWSNSDFSGFESACSTMASNMPVLINQCDRSLDQMRSIGGMPLPYPPPPPRPPPPPPPGK